MLLRVEDPRFAEPNQRQYHSGSRHPKTKDRASFIWSAAAPSALFYSPTICRIPNAYVQAIEIDGRSRVAR